ncbi:TPA: hypothetical protein DCW61_03610 [Candidatus Uhrbacteria bacterium]|nr:hypothetical protein [Candidatus Uhrbacteria bacterium]
MLLIIDEKRPFWYSFARIKGTKRSPFEGLDTAVNTTPPCVDKLVSKFSKGFFKKNPTKIAILPFTGPHRLITVCEYGDESISPFKAISSIFVEFLHQIIKKRDSVPFLFNYSLKSS